MGQNWPPLVVEVSRLSLWLVGLVAVFVPLERLFAVHPHKILRKGIATDLGYYFVSSLLLGLLLGPPSALLAWGANHVIPDRFLAMVAGLPFWARVLAAFVAGEFGYYWGHRWSHQVPFLWRFHAIHHSAEEMDFLVNTRAHPFDLAFGRFCGLVPIYALGLAGPATLSGAAVPFVVLLIGTVWGFFIHANLRCRFGPLEWLISTPGFHHWHHTRTGPINRNYASTLPWLDWIFGSLYLPGGWPADYGIRAKLPEALVDQLVYPLFPPAQEPAAPQEAAPTAGPHPDPTEAAPPLDPTPMELAPP